MTARGPSSSIHRACPLGGLDRREEKQAPAKPVVQVIAPPGCLAASARRGLPLSCAVRTTHQNLSVENVTMQYMWAHAAERWLIEMAHKRTIDGDRRKLDWINTVWRGLTLVEVDRHRIAELGERKRSEASAATANRYLALVRAITRRAAFDWEWIARPPKVTLYPEKKRRVRWLTPEQVSTLLEQLPPHQHDPVVFALATGLRHANVVGLKWPEVDLKRRTAWVFGDETKNGEDLHVSLNDVALSILKRRYRGRTGQQVFTYRGRPLARLSTRAWYNALKRAGIQNFRFHDLRHTWASWLVQEGVPLYALQEMGGWKTGSMVRRYAHLAPATNLQHACSIDRSLGRGLSGARVERRDSRG
jgi:integrase